MLPGIAMSENCGLSGFNTIEIPPCPTQERHSWEAYFARRRRAYLAKAYFVPFSRDLSHPLQLVNK